MIRLSEKRKAELQNHLENRTQPIDFIDFFGKERIFSDLDDIRFIYEYLLNRVDDLQKEVEYLKTEQYKDDTIHELQKQIQEIYANNEIVLNRQNKSKLDKFKAEHCSKCKAYLENDVLAYQLERTHIDDFIVVSCPCGQTYIL